MAKKVLILAGAPDSQSLDWTPASLVAQAHIATRASLTKGPPDHAVWRSISLKREHIRTGFSQQHDPGLIVNLPIGKDTDFFTSFAASAKVVIQTHSSRRQSWTLLELLQNQGTTALLQRRCTANPDVRLMCTFCVCRMPLAI